MKYVMLIILMFGLNINVANATGPAYGWYGPFSVKTIEGLHYKDAGTNAFFLNFIHYGNQGVCGETVPTNLKDILVSTLSASEPSSNLKSMESLLLTALTTGLKIKVQYNGTNCQAQSIVICADANNCPSP